MVLFRLEEERFKNESRLAELEEARAELSRIRTLLSDRDRIAKLVRLALEEHCRKSFADREAEGIDGAIAVADKLRSYLLGSEGS